MLGTLIQKELRAIILSPKFTATFAVCSVLLLLSVFIGIREYKQTVAQHETAVQLADQRIQEISSWHGMRDKTYRKPDPLQILVSGLTYDIGRWSSIDSRSTVKLKNSAFSDDPIFAVFRFVDFAFIVQIVFSLFAILFTFDAVNGERENGTLRLVFSNAVPRAKYIIGKCLGSWLGLVVPICIPIALSLLMINIFGVPMTAGEWGRVALLVALSLLYVTLFVVMGVFVSSLTKRSSVSFLLSLVVWVLLVLIIPRGGVLAAGQLASVPRLAEIEGLRDGHAKNLWSQHRKEMEERFLARHDAREERDDDDMWAEMKFEDSARKDVQIQIEAYEVRLMEDWDRRKATQQRLALTLSRFSPAAAYQLAAQTLAGTDLSLKPRNEEAMRTYRKEFNQYVDEKQAEGGHVGGIQISIGSDEGMKITTSRDNAGLDIDDRPRYTLPQQQLAAVIQPAVTDFGLLAFGTILLFAGAFVSFLRYDLR